MLRASLIAIVAVSLAACDDESETAVEEVGTEVEVAAESAEEETAEVAAEAEAEVESAAAEAEEAAAEAEAVADVEGVDAAEAEAGTEESAAGAAGAEDEAAEGEDVTVLTSESPAVETTVLTSAETEEITPSGSEGESEETGEESEDAAAEGEETQLAAAETETEPAAGGDEADPLARYSDWVQGRWGASASCDSNVVELEENAISLPGGVSCSEIDVADAGSDSLAITGSSCEGAGDLAEVEIEVTESDEGITLMRDGQEASLVRCE